MTSNRLTRLAQLLLALALLASWACNREPIPEPDISELPTTTFLGEPVWYSKGGASRSSAGGKSTVPHALLPNARVPLGDTACLTMVGEGNRIPLITVHRYYQQPNQEGKLAYYGRYAAFNANQQLLYVVLLENNRYTKIGTPIVPTSYEAYMKARIARSDRYDGEIDGSYCWGEGRDPWFIDHGTNGDPTAESYNDWSEGGGSSSGGDTPTEDTKKDPEDPKDPCAHAKAMNNDPALKDRLQPYASELNNGGKLENGYLLKSDGTYVYPSTRTETQMTYNYNSSSVFIESLHTHPGNEVSNVCLSLSDIKALGNRYNMGHIAYGTASNFREIVISSYGVSMLQITDEDKFQNFINKINNNSQILGELDFKFSSIVQRADLNEAMADYLALLADYNTGLSFSFSSGTNMATLSLQAMELNATNYTAVNKDCK